MTHTTCDKLNIKNRFKTKRHELHSERRFEWWILHLFSHLCLGTIYTKVLTDSSSFPVKLCSGFQENHTDVNNKANHFVKRKCNTFLLQRKLQQRLLNQIIKTYYKASYLIRYRVSWIGEAHTIADTLIKPRTDKDKGYIIRAWYYKGLRNQLYDWYNKRNIYQPLDLLNLHY